MKARRMRDERGSISTGAVLLVTVFTLILGIAVDLSGQVQTRRQAHEVAGQAARIKRVKISDVSMDEVQRKLMPLL